MISKKILALVLALSVIVCALPAFSVFAAEETQPWPYAAETLVNPRVIFSNALVINLDNASNGLQATITNGMASSQAMKVSGEVVFAGKTVKLNNFIIRSSNAVHNQISGWGSDFAAHDKEFLAEMVAADLPEYELDTNGNISTGATAETIRNFVRYIMYLKGEDYNAVEGDLRNHTIEAESATLTFAPLSSTFASAYPEGSYFLPLTVDYVKFGLDGTFKQQNQMYVPKSSNAGVGPYAFYKVDKAGEYKVWLLKRDQTADAPNTNRDVYIDFGAQTLNFSGIEGCPAAVDNVNYYMAPEDSGATVNLKADKYFKVQINNKTGVYAGCYGLLLVPVEKANSVTITGTNATNADAVLSFTMAATAGKVAHTGALEPKTITATVNGTPITVTSDDAQKYYSTVATSDKDGYYIENATIIDAIIAADIAGVELPFEIAKGENAGDTVTPITYDTLAVKGTMWPTHTNGNGYNHLWTGTEIFCSNSTAVFGTTVDAPEAGNYYLFANGCGWDASRWLKLGINGGAEIKLFAGIKSPTTVVLETPVALNKGANTVTMSTTGNWIRCSYLGFVKADSYAAAQALVSEITASKEAFNTYFGGSNGSVFINGKFNGFNGVYTVDGVAYSTDLDTVEIADGAVIEISALNKTNFDPFSVGGYFGAYGGSASSDQLVAVGGFGGKYTVKFVSYSDGSTLPLDVSETDAFADCYLNGYVTIKEDCQGQTVGALVAPDTTGDDRIVKIFINDWKIVHTVKGTRTEFGFNGVHPGGDTGGAYATLDLDPSVEGEETYHSDRYIKTGSFELYDFSNLYLTNSKSAAKAQVTATETATGYNLTCNKSVPVCLVKVTTVDGVVTATEIENTFIDFMDADGIDVELEEGQTMYVWTGTGYNVGSRMVPLCAPVTK